MFDLFRSRQKAVRYMLIGLLSVVALSMVTYLIPGFGNAATKTAENDGVLADIGNTKLTAQEVVTAMQSIIQRGQLPPEMVDVYVPQIVDEMVQQRAIVYQFEHMGLTVSDDEVLVGLQSVNPSGFRITPRTALPASIPRRISRSIRLLALSGPARERSSHSVRCGFRIVKHEL